MLKRIAWGLLLLALLASCAKPPVRQSVDFDPEVDFMALKAWNWAGRQPAFSDVLIGDDPIDRFVRKAVTQELDAKGLRLVADAPDFLVAYSIRLREDVSTQPGTNSTGYAVWRWVKDLGRGWSREANRAGVLELRFLDRAGEKVIWSGSVDDPVRDANEARAKIPEAVSSLLEDFPPRK